MPASGTAWPLRPTASPGTGHLLSDPVVGAIAAQASRTPAQVLLCWCVQRGVLALSKSTHRDRIAENSRIFDFELRATGS
jgi:diketogulonate reductase-like aldo/keto reductase